MVGTARREHGDVKPQMIKGLVLMGPKGADRAFHGMVLGNGAHRAFLWLQRWLGGSRAVAYQPQAGLQSDFDDPAKLSVI